jgi:mono/diheme cytochrome c family protein
MKTITVCLSVAVCLSLSGLLILGTETAAMDEAGVKALFEQKCSTCHSADRPKSKTKTAAEWTKTVMRMKNVNGCPITDEEAKLIIGYLAKNYGPM